LVLLTGGGVLKPQRSGLDAKLTLDLSIQAIVEEELDWGLREFESTRGAVVMLEPRTGDVLAMASRPHFNLNLLQDIEGRERHYAVQAIYEPGSTFKLVSTAAALDLGTMNPWDEIFCHNGYMTIPGGYVKDYKGFGNLSLEEVLSKSSNIGAYKIGLRVNPTRYMKYLHDFGFMQKTGIILSGEQRGLITDYRNGINFSRITYGYGIAVTPLQVACAYAAIANDGMRMKPRLVQSLLANDGTEVQSYPPEEVKQVVSKSTARKLRNALETVVNPKGKGNTGKRASVPGYLVCGKTGTARILSDAGIYLPNHYAVSFAGFMPRDNPAFVCVVVLHDPRTNKVKVGGGSVAAPVFQRIAARTAAYLNLKPTEPIEDEAALASADH
jgi:cell division protein FtsI/penicillin-binding protein 2